MANTLLFPDDNPTPLASSSTVSIVYVASPNAGSRRDWYLSKRTLAVQTIKTFNTRYLMVTIQPCPCSSDLLPAFPNTHAQQRLVQELLAVLPPKVRFHQ